MFCELIVAKRLFVNNVIDSQLFIALGLSFNYLFCKLDKLKCVFCTVTEQGNIIIACVSFQAGCKHFETHKWFNSLIFYGWKDISLEPPNADDLKLVPNLVDKVLVPKLTG